MPISEIAVYILVYYIVESLHAAHLDSNLLGSPEAGSSSPSEGTP